MDHPVTLPTTVMVATLDNGVSLDETEAVIVVAIRRRIPVAVRGTQIRWIIVPGAAAKVGISLDRFPTPGPRAESSRAPGDSLMGHHLTIKQRSS